MTECFKVLQSLAVDDGSTDGLRNLTTGNLLHLLQCHSSTHTQKASSTVICTDHADIHNKELARFNQTASTTL